MIFFLISCSVIISSSIILSHFRDIYVCECVLS